jgi:hypothetical protein
VSQLKIPNAQAKQPTIEHHLCDEDSQFAIHKSMQIDSAMLRLFVFIATLAAASSQDCNICGEGNSIQAPTGVVEFVYQGQARKNNCQTWQNIVKNPNAISDEFCRNEMLQYTVVVCSCTAPDGTLVADTFMPPTTAPANTTMNPTTSQPRQGTVIGTTTAPSQAPTTAGAPGSVNRCTAEGGTVSCSGGNSTDTSGCGPMLTSVVWGGLIIACAIIV